MTRKTFFKSLIMAGILPLCAFANDGGVTKEEKQDIEFVNNNGDALNDKTLQVPVTATLSNEVLNVQFTGTVPHATVRVNNALTGGTVTQQSMTALQGTICTVPVAGLDMGTYTVSVTNNLNGQSVSGDFQVNSGKE